MKGIGQVEGQRGGGCNGAGINQLAIGWGHGLAQLPKEDFRAGQQQSCKPYQQQFQQHWATALHPPGLWLRWGGGSVETVDPQSTQSERGDAQRHCLQRRKDRITTAVSISQPTKTWKKYFKVKKKIIFYYSGFRGWYQLKLFLVSLIYIRFHHPCIWLLSLCSFDVWARFDLWFSSL